MSTIIILVTSIAVIMGIASYKLMGPDNPIEEACEVIIKAETGVTVDLSPNEDGKAIKEEKSKAQEPSKDVKTAQQNICDAVSPGANGPAEPSSTK